MTKPKDCPICRDDRMRAELITCPLCGEPGLLPELNELARQWIEEYRDRERDERVFGTLRPKPN